MTIADVTRRISHDERRTYPPLRAPVLPVLSWASLRRRRGARVPSLWDAGRALGVSSGTSAIALALRLGGVGEGDRVLAPAYHCPSMIDPIRELGARPVYYRVDQRLNVDIADIESRSAGARALLVAHYFGFPQPVARLRAYCEAQGMVLIEDCAHAFFGDFDGRPPGWSGHFAIGSVHKFFPVDGGGYLVGGDDALAALPARTGAGGFTRELKAAVNVLEEAVRYDRLQPLNWMLKGPLWLKRALRARPGDAVAGAPAGPAGDPPAGAVAHELPISRVSDFIARHAGVARIVERRRRNFLALARGIAARAGVRPLRDALPEGVVPYMFPLLVEDGHVFPTLRKRGVPVWRWEDGEPDDCANSRRYATELLQLPCHQELGSRELAWLIDTVNSVVSRP